MIVFIFDLGVLAAVETLFVSIPEAVGLFAFGLLLVLLAVVLRSHISAGEQADTRKQAVKSER